MKGYNIFIVLLVVLVQVCSGQDRGSLEKARNSIIKDIERTNKELSKTKTNKNNALSELQNIDKQISNRKKLIANIKSQLESADAAIDKNDQHILSLKSKQASIKEQYHKLLHYMYIKDITESKWVYLLSASSLNESFLRWRYLKQFEVYTENKKQEISKLTGLIDKNISSIKEEKTYIQSLLAEEKENIGQLKKDQQRKDQILKSLKDTEKNLISALNKKKKERERLNRAIEEIILAELSKRKKERKTTTKRSTTSSRFSKGSLTWPVQGKVTSRFGKQAHPTIPSLEINNNGIDISASSGTVRCVAQGEVIGVTNVPGYDMMVIVQHGEYYTVYSKMKKVAVSKGNKVKEGDTIGSLSEGKVLHFELWKDKSKLDPQKWLK